MTACSAEVVSPGREGLFDKVAADRRCRRSIPRDRIGGHLGMIQDFMRGGRRPAASRRRAAPTTSRAWPWSSARSRAPRPGGAWRSPHMKDNDAKPASRHPHRHHGAGQSRRPGRLCPGRSCRSASRASSRSSGRRWAARTCRGLPARSARRSAMPTSSVGSLGDVRQSARGRRARPRDAAPAGKTLIDNAHLFGTDMVSRLHRAACAASRCPTACRASAKSGARSPSAPPTRACASPSRTAPWTATGRPATGTSPTIPTPGS